MLKHGCNFADRVEVHNLAHYRFREVRLPQYKTNSKYLGNLTGIANEHRCAAHCLLADYGTETCNFFKFDNITLTCMMGNFDRNDTFMEFDVFDTVYLDIGKLFDISKLQYHCY